MEFKKTAGNFLRELGAIQRLYPEDEAPGFNANDLEGVYRIEYPLVDRRPPIEAAGE